MRNVTDFRENCEKCRGFVRNAGPCVTYLGHTQGIAGLVWVKASGPRHFRTLLGIFEGFCEVCSGFIGQFLLKPVGFRAKSEVYGPNLEEIGRLEWAFTYVKTQAILCVFSFAHQPCAHEFFIFFC